MAVRVFSTTVGSISFVSLAVMGTRGLTSEPVVNKAPGLQSGSEVLDHCRYSYYSTSEQRSTCGSLQSLGNPPSSCFVSSCRTPSTRMTRMYNRYRSVATIPAAFVRSPDGSVAGFSRSIDRNSRRVAWCRAMTGLHGISGNHHVAGSEGSLIIRREAASGVRRRGDSWRLDSGSSAADRPRSQDVAETGGGKLSPLQSLRNSVAALPRMTREEEAALAEDVKRWQRLDKMRRDVGSGGSDEEAGELEAWALAAGMTVSDLREQAARAAGARERLVLSHIRLVIYLARRRGWSTAASCIDLVQEGAIALNVAVDRYDPSRGVRFFTYADWALRAAFEQAEAEQHGSVVVPRHLYVQMRRLRAAIMSETAVRHRAPTLQELAAALDTTEKRVANLLRWSDPGDSMDRVLISGDSLSEITPGPQGLEVHLQRLDAEAVLGRLLEGLKPQEAEVIVHLYGLFGTGRKSTVAISGAMGVSRQYVGRVHRAALEKMRASLEHRSEGARTTTGNTNRRKDSSSSSSSSSRWEGASKSPSPSKARRARSERRELGRSEAFLGAGPSSSTPSSRQPSPEIVGLTTQEA